MEGGGGGGEETMLNKSTSPEAVIAYNFECIGVGSQDELLALPNGLRCHVLQKTEG